MDLRLGDFAGLRLLGLLQLGLRLVQFCPGLIELHLVRLLVDDQQELAFLDVHPPR